jgi:hypothetical protein
MKLPPLNSLSLVRAAGLLLAGAFVLLLLRFWHPVYRFTFFLQLDASIEDSQIPAFNKYPVFPNTGGYDGQYYAQIAFDPTLRDPALVPATDNLAYRARRILPPALAWLLAGGNPAAIVHVYTALNIVAWIALAVLLWRFLPVRDVRGLLAWTGVMFSAGAIGSVRLALTDLIALAIIAASLFAAEKNRSSLAAGLAGLSGLTRETSLLALGGMLRAPWLSGRNLARVIVAIAPLAIWLFFLRARFGSIEAGWGNFALPVAGLALKIQQNLHAVLHGNPDHVALAWTGLLSTTALIVQAAFFLTRWKPDDAWWRVGAPYVVLMLFLGNAVWEGFPGAATRVLLPLTLAFNVSVVRRRAGLVWLLLGNLAVASGWQTLTSVPTDPTDLSSARAHGLALVARTGPGWYGVERNSRHAWSWNSGDGKLLVKSWPAVSRRTVEFRGELRSLAPCNVTVTQGGRVVWRGVSTNVKTPFGFSFVVADGGAELEFSTDAPGVRENASPDARTLAFAVYDAQLVISEN